MSRPHGLQGRHPQPAADHRPDGMRRMPAGRASAQALRPGHCKRRSRHDPHPPRPRRGARPGADHLRHVRHPRPPRLLLQGRPGGLDRRAGVGDRHPAVAVCTSTRRSDVVLGRDERAEQRDGVGLLAELPALTENCRPQAQTALVHSAFTSSLY